MRSKLSTAMFAAKELALNFANKNIHISEIQGLPWGDLAFLLRQAWFKNYIQRISVN